MFTESIHSDDKVMLKEKCGATYYDYLVGLVGLDMPPMRRFLGILEIHIMDNFDAYTHIFYQAPSAQSKEFLDN